VNRIDIYKTGGRSRQGVAAKSDLRTSKLIDGVVWDGKEPRSMRGSFKIQGCVT